MNYHMDPQLTKPNKLGAILLKPHPGRGKPSAKPKPRGVEQIHSSANLTKEIKDNAQKAKSPSNTSKEDFEAILRILFSNQESIAGRSGKKEFYNHLISTVPDLTKEDGKVMLQKKINTLNTSIRTDHNGKTYTLKDLVKAFLGLVCLGEKIHNEIQVRGKDIINPTPQKLALWIDKPRERNASLKNLACANKINLEDRLEAIKLIDNRDTKRDALVKFLRNFTPPGWLSWELKKRITERFNEVLNSLYGAINDTEQKRNTYKKLASYIPNFAGRHWLAKTIQDPEGKQSVHERIIEQLPQTGQIEFSMFNELMDDMKLEPGLSSGLKEWFIKKELEALDKNPKEYIERAEFALREYIFQNKINDSMQDSLAIKQALNQDLTPVNRAFFLRHIHGDMAFHNAFNTIQEEINTSNLTKVISEERLKIFAEILLQRESKHFKDNPNAPIHGLLKLLENPVFPMKKEFFEIIPSGAMPELLSRVIPSLLADQHLAPSIVPRAVQMIEKLEKDEEKKKHLVNLFNLPSIGPSVRYCIFENVKNPDLKAELVDIIKNKYPLIIPIHIINTKGIEALETIMPPNTPNKQMIQAYLDQYLPDGQEKETLSLDAYKNVMDKYGHFFTSEEKDEQCWKFFFGTSKKLYLETGGKFDHAVYESKKHKIGILNFMSEAGLKDLLNRCEILQYWQIANKGYFRIAILNAFKKDSRVLEQVLSQQSDDRLVAIGKCPELKKDVCDKILSKLNDPRDKAEVLKKYPRY